VVPKLDRLARSVPDARAIGDDLAGRGIKLSLGGQVYDPATRWARCSSTSWPPSPSSKSTCCGCGPARAWAIARAKGKLRGKQPKLSARQQRELARMAATGEYTIADLAELFTVSRATVYRTLQRTPAAGAAGNRTASSCLGTASRVPDLHSQRATANSCAVLPRTPLTSRMRGAGRSWGG
jgi:hypothetical protein